MAAEEEKVRIKATGMISGGKFDQLISGAKSLDIPVKAPEARSIPTAIIKPTKVGRISTTTFKPSVAPSIKA